MMYGCFAKNLTRKLEKVCNYFFVLFVFSAVACKFHECHDLLCLCKLPSRTGNICTLLFLFYSAYQSVISVVHLILLVFRSAIKTLLLKHRSTEPVGHPEILVVLVLIGH